MYPIGIWLSWRYIDRPSLAVYWVCLTYEYFEPYDQVHPYVMHRSREYHPVLEENLNRGLIFWVLVDSRRQTAGRYEPLDLPCFR